MPGHRRAALTSAAAAVVMAFAVCLLGLALPVSAAHASSGPSNTLHAGQVLRAGTSHDTLESRNGRYTLQVTSKIVTMTEAVYTRKGQLFEYVETWAAYDATNRDIGGKDATTFESVPTGAST